MFVIVNIISKLIIIFLCLLYYVNYLYVCITGIINDIVVAGYHDDRYLCGPVGSGHTTRWNRYCRRL